MTLRCRHQQLAQPLGRAVAVGETHHHVEAPDAIHDLTGDAPVGQSLQRSGQRGGREAVERRFGIVRHDAKLRDADLSFDLQIHEASHASHPSAQPFGERAQAIEIGAEELHRDLRPHARQHVV